MPSAGVIGVVRQVIGISVPSLREERVLRITEKQSRELISPELLRRYERNWGQIETPAQFVRNRRSRIPPPSCRHQIPRVGIGDFGRDAEVVADIGPQQVIPIPGIGSAEY